MSQQPDSEIDVQAFFGVLRRHARMVVLFVVLVGLVVYAWSATRPERYRAVARVQVVSDDGAATNRNVNRQQTEQEVRTQVELIESRGLRQRLDDALGDAAGEVQSVGATPVDGTPIVRIQVESGSPELAQRAANTLSELFVERQRQVAVAALEGQAEELREAARELTVEIDELNAAIVAGQVANPPAALAERNALVEQREAFLEEAADLVLRARLRSGGVAEVDEASLPTDPFEPRPARDAVFAALIALLFAITVVLLVERIDDRVRATDDLERLAPDLPVLASVPVHRAGPPWLRLRLSSLPRRGARELVPLGTSAGEAYRALRTALRFSAAGARRRAFAVTSSVGGEGKTTVTANLGAALAESGLRVVVVSGDLRSPELAGVFGVPDRDRGLSTVLTGHATLEECLVDVELPAGGHLQVLPAGTAVANPAELLGSPEFGHLLGQLLDDGADYVLVDCSPVLPVSDTSAMVRHVDGVLLLSARGVTRMGALADTLERLHQVDATVVGFVFNGADPTNRAYARYYRYDSNGSGPAPAADPPNGSDADPVASRTAAKGATSTGSAAAGSTTSPGG